MPNNAMIPQEPPPPSAKPPPCAVVLKLLRQIAPKLLQIKIFPKKINKKQQIWIFYNNLDIQEIWKIVIANSLDCP